MDLQWETPPPPTKRGREVDSVDREVAAELRSHPDQWARVADFTGAERRKAGSYATNINTGRRAAFRVDFTKETGEFQAKSRRIPDTDVTAVFVRYSTLTNTD